MPKDKVVFITGTKEHQKEFEALRKLLFNDIEKDIEAYENELEEIKDPKNKRSQDDIDFERAVCVDHIIMAIQERMNQKS